MTRGNGSSADRERTPPTLSVATARFEALEQMARSVVSARRRLLRRITRDSHASQTIDDA